MCVFIERPFNLAPEFRYIFSKGDLFLGGFTGISCIALHSEHYVLYLCVWNEFIFSIPAL
jgi:hypothetical protein